MIKVGSLLVIILIISCVDRTTLAQEVPQKSLMKINDVLDCNSPPRPQILPGSVVMLVGDSLAAGMEGRFKSLARMNGYVPVVHAINGTSIFQWNGWIKKDLEVHNPDLVLVSLGTNDAVIYDKVRQNPNEYRKLIKTIEATGAKIVWIGPSNISRTRILKIDETRKIIRESVPVFFESEKYETPQAGDGIHSSMNGYSNWMKSIWSWIISKNIIANISQCKVCLFFDKMET